MLAPLLRRHDDTRNNRCKTLLTSSKDKHVKTTISLLNRALLKKRVLNFCYCKYMLECKYNMAAY